MSGLPRITVVTPSYNQAAFLEQTIQSVLGQLYENLEYFIIDGGSTDDSVRIIQRYAGKLAGWLSEEDGGQAHAINKGFAQATGDILCWLNSDDFFLPGALHRVAREFSQPVDLIYGDCLSFWETGRRSVVNRPPEHDRDLLSISDYIVQPSAFWRRTLWDGTGPLNEHLHYAFDWEWFLRADRRGVFEKCGAIFSAYRFHDTHKSSSGGEKRAEEITTVAREQGGPRAARHYEFAQRHLAALKRHASVVERLRNRGVARPAQCARWAVPQLWNLPRDLQLEDLQRCLQMLRR